MKIWRFAKALFFPKLVLQLAFAFAFSTAFLSAATSKPSKTIQTAKPPTIRVLLSQGDKGALLEARGAFAVFNPENGKKLSSGIKSKRFYLYPHEEGIKWGEDFPGIFQLQIVPTEPTTTFLIDGIQYRGAIEVYHIENTLSIINEVDVETFLKATLTEKVSPELLQPVLNAIAIIARTNTYYTALLNHASFYHLKAEDIDYHGIGLTKQNLAIEQAIESTRHLIMTYRHQPFPATWTTHCAGKTASYAQIFRKQTPAPPGVKSPVALNDRSEAHWNFICEAQELAQAVKLNRITSIDLFADPESNKVYGLRVRDGNYAQEISFTELQQIIGHQRLKSNDFTVSVQGNLLAFEGYGEGLGSGLCLYSAAHLSTKGDAAPELLNAFFPHTDLKKMDTYPKTIISADHPTFVSPKQREQQHKILNQ
ncbi:MAG: SpoIID/LytB domain-containing protein [Chlamydiota bacterium]